MIHEVLKIISCKNTNSIKTLYSMEEEDVHTAVGSFLDWSTHTVLNGRNTTHYINPHCMMYITCPALLLSIKEIPCIAHHEMHIYNQSYTTAVPSCMFWTITDRNPQMVHHDCWKSQQMVCMSKCTFGWDMDILPTVKISPNITYYRQTSEHSEMTGTFITMWHVCWWISSNIGQGKLISCNNYSDMDSGIHKLLWTYSKQIGPPTYTDNY